jgi:hypothetical protein
MESFTFLFGANAWLVALLLFVGCFAAAEIGFFGARRWKKEEATLKKENIKAVQTAVAALLGLLLAFSVSMAVDRYENRKAAVVDEANAIGTAYLRVTLLPEPQRGQAEQAFKSYLDLRLELARPDWFTSADAGLRTQQDELQRDIWAVGVSASQIDPRAVTTGLYVEAVNEMIDSAGRRDAGLRNHVPESVLYMIFAVCLVTVGTIGFFSGLEGARSLVATIMICVVLAAVVFVIMDFDRPYRGILRVGQQPMIELRQSMDEGLPLP